MKWKIFWWGFELIYNIQSCCLQLSTETLHELAVFRMQGSVPQKRAYTSTSHYFALMEWKLEKMMEFWRHESKNHRVFLKNDKLSCVLTVIFKFWSIIIFFKQSNDGLQYVIRIFLATIAQVHLVLGNLILWNLKRRSSKFSITALKSFSSNSSMQSSSSFSSLIWKF